MSLQYHQKFDSVLPQGHFLHNSVYHKLWVMCFYSLLTASDQLSQWDFTSHNWIYVTFIARPKNICIWNYALILPLRYSRFLVISPFKFLIMAITFHYWMKSWLVSSLLWHSLQTSLFLVQFFCTSLKRPSIKCKNNDNCDQMLVCNLVNHSTVHIVMALFCICGHLLWYYM